MKSVFKNYLFFIATILSLSAAAQVPVLNSYPESPNVIFLDFDGHIVSGTSWNSGSAIVCEPSTLNTAQIITIFNRVAEDYRPFTVNVTTDSTKYMAAPANRRMRVVLTVSSEWYGSAGGVAFINSYSWGDNTPCFVFTALLNNNTKNIAEAASHEAGHTLGLRHQSSYDAVCAKVSEYNYGKGSGEIGWAPIMGIGYYQNMTLWNYGANPYGCNNFQDDLSIITSNANGIGFRTDDYTGVIADASTIAFTNNAFSVAGIIERPNDADAIKFSISEKSRFQLDATPFSIGSLNSGSNVDIEMQLIDNLQNVIGTYNSSATLNSSIDTTLDAGVYYLVTKGQGNIYAPNYASLGSYTLTASSTPVTALPLRKFLLKGTSENKQHKLSWDIIADETIVSQNLEVATNGGQFHSLASLNEASRNYSYIPFDNSINYYRLKVVFDNGKQYYSNTIALRNSGTNGKPYLVGNLVAGSLTISSPSATTYTVNDVTGRTITKGNLLSGIHIVPFPTSQNGVYIIQFQTGSELFTEKFIRR